MWIWDEHENYGYSDHAYAELKKLSVGGLEVQIGRYDHGQTGGAYGGISDSAEEFLFRRPFGDYDYVPESILDEIEQSIRREREDSELATLMDRLAKMATKRQATLYRQQGLSVDRKFIYGVSRTKLRKLAEEIGGNHRLAIQLFFTNNADAQILAMSLLRPRKISMKLAERMIRNVEANQNALKIPPILPDLLAKRLSENSRIVNGMWQSGHSTDSLKFTFRRHCGMEIVSCVLRRGGQVPIKHCRALLRLIKKRGVRRPATITDSAAYHVMSAIGVHMPKLKNEVLALLDQLAPDPHGVEDVRQAIDSARNLN